MKWRDVEIFLAVYDARTTGGAATTLKLNQSTVSRRLAALEKELGAHLFDRMPEGLEPTAAGHEAHAQAELMRQAANRLALGLTAGGQDVRGCVRVSLFTGAARELLVPELPELLRQYPELSISLSESPRVDDLVRREADIAVRLVPPKSGELVYKRVVTLRFAIYAAHGRVDNPAPPLASLPWVGWDDSLRFLTEAQWLTHAVPNANIVLTSTDQSTLVAAIEAGVGVGILPVSLAARHPQLRQIHAGRTSELKQGVFMVAHANVRRLPRFSVVWDFLERRLTEDSA